MFKCTYNVSKQKQPKPSVCIVGAGFAGVLAGIKLKTKLGIVDFVIFDQNDEVGGVWLVNTYPGCGSDSPTHLYSYSFEMNPEWSENFGSQEEILKYMQGVAKKNKLEENIQFQSKVEEVKWDKDLGKWRILVSNTKNKTLKEHIFRLVINAPGALRVPNIPEKFKHFEGPTFHSACWNRTLNLEGKVVGVVGSGASAVQLIPYLGQKVKELHCYQRKPAWVLPKVNFKFPASVIWIFKYIPFAMLFFRWHLFWIMEVFFLSLRHGTCLRQIVKWIALKYLNRVVAEDESLRQKLTPNYALGCTRIIISNEYLQTMKLKNVTLHTDPISEVACDSILTENGRKQRIDVLILATGFKVQEYFAPMSIFGVEGHDLLEEWMKQRPKGYLGIMTITAPNQFALLGPHTGLGHNSVLFMMECQMNYIVQLIREMMRQGAAVIELKESAQVEEMQLLETRMKKMVWGNGNCGSWYENSNGINTTLWPWNCFTYWRRTYKADFKKFNFLGTIDKIVVMNNNNFSGYDNPGLVLEKY